MLKFAPLLRESEMVRSATAVLTIVLAVLFTVAGRQAQAGDMTAIAARVEALVERHFYKPVDFPKLVGNVDDRTIDDALTDLKASHTGRIRPDMIDYFEVFDIYRRRLEADAKRIFAGQDNVGYRGIGVATAPFGRTHVVTDVYPGTPAARAGILRGDEIIAVDGQPFQEIKSFERQREIKARLTIRRLAGEPTRDVALPVETIRPGAVFRQATRDSVRVIGEGNRKIGYARLWTMHDGDVHNTIYEELATGRLKDIDVLILDLRGRWGGVTGLLADIFEAKATEIEFVPRHGKPGLSPLRWRKPVVGIIDEGSRSAMEILAFVLKKNGARLVGKRTAGAVLSGDVFVLPDDSLLTVAARDVIVDGERLEGKGVAPDIEVDNPLPYSAGADPQFEAALKAAKEMLAPAE